MFDDDLEELFSTPQHNTFTFHTHHLSSATAPSSPMILAHDPNEEECQHTSTIIDGTKRICKGCNCEVDVLEYEAEWKFHTGINTNNASRCTRYRETKKGSNILKIFQDAKIPYELVNEQRRERCEEKYNIIVGKQNVHGVKRKAIVAACMMHVFREDGDIRHAKEFRDLFGLSAQQMAHGVGKYHKSFPESRVDVIHTNDLIKYNMMQLNIAPQHEQSILRIAKQIEESNAELNRSSPNSVAPAIIYVYLSCIQPNYKLTLGLNKQTFASLVKTSALTISRLAKIIAQIIGEKFDDS